MYVRICNFYAVLGIILGPIASVIVTPIFCILRSAIYVPLIRDDLLEEVKKKVNVVEAHLVKSYISYINIK